MVRVMAFGTFDLLHPGHKHFLAQAQALGDELIVVVARDATVRHLKGRQSAHPEEHRLAQVASLEQVSKAVLGSEGDKYAVIEEYQPNIIALGYDQRGFADRLQEELLQRCVKATIVRLLPHKEHKYKSSKLRGL